MTEVTVLVGAGSIGRAIARRVSSGRTVLVADLHRAHAEKAAMELDQAGFRVETDTVDISSGKSVYDLVDRATRLGDVTRMVHAAGVSPSQASPQTIMRVDLYGTALLLDAFGDVIAPGGSGVVISSQSGYRMPALTAEQDRQLATVPSGDLLKLDFVHDVDDSLLAYQLAKRGNGLRVKGQAPRWGQRGARLNAISPGIIITPLAHDELNGPRGEGYRRMLDQSPVGRPGTPDEIGDLAAFIMGEQGGYITGSDFLVDGGVTASWYYGPLQP